MFGKKESTNVKITSMLGAGAELQGDFINDGSARIDGTVNGDVRIKGMLILGSTGKISGNVEAESAVLGGEVLGNVLAPEKAELTDTARVLGDVTTKTIVIDENAVFQGRCNMNPNLTGEADGPQAAQRAVAVSVPEEKTIAEKMRDVLQKDAADGVSEKNRSEKEGAF